MSSERRVLLVVRGDQNEVNCEERRAGQIPWEMNYEEKKKANWRLVEEQ